MKAKSMAAPINSGPTVGMVGKHSVGLSKANFRPFSGFRRGYISLLSIFCVFLALGMLTPTEAQAKRPRILYLNSDTPDDYWWRTSSEIMQAACDDLGMDLKVVYAARDRFKMVEAFNAAANDPIRPDAVVFQNLKQNAVEMLEIAEKIRIPAFIFNAGLTSEQTEKYGGPREHFKYWIGQMLPDDKTAGYDLAMSLYHEAVKQGITDANGTVQFIGINGTSADGAAIERSEGLALAVKKEPKIALRQLVSGHWNRDEGKSIFLVLNRRYPEVKVVWAANDPMGLGALDGVIERKLVPGKDMLIGSIDWVPEALQEVNGGRLVTSIGGHFMEAGWVAVLLHDYFQHKDFATEAVSFKSKMATLSKTDIAGYLRKFRVDNFKTFNFRQFSKVDHSEIKRYDFRFSRLMNVVEENRVVE